MSEYFVVANSFAAPFFSDQSTAFVEANDPELALHKFQRGYRHPSGLYSAACFGSADDFHKNKPPLARWISNHEAAKQRITKDMPAYSHEGHEPGSFSINGKPHTVTDPKGGRIVRASG